MDFKVDLLKKWGQVDSSWTNALLSQNVSVFYFVKVEGLNSTFRQSECLKWTQAIVRLIDVIYDHQRVSEIAISLDQLHQVRMREGKAQVAAHIKSNLVVSIVQSGSLRVHLYNCPKILKWIFVGIWLDLCNENVVHFITSIFFEHSTNNTTCFASFFLSLLLSLGVIAINLCPVFAVLAMLDHIEHSWSVHDDSVDWNTILNAESAFVCCIVFVFHILKL